jgi:hypothetical protein
MTTLINGWEYCTHVVPGKVTEQTLQTEYLTEYSLAYHKFLSSICKSESDLSKIKTERIYPFKIYIDCNDDIINPDSNYYIKFTKSKFLKTKLKKLKGDLYKYYNSNGFLVRGPYELQMNIYCIDLFELKDKNTDNSETPAQN